MIKILAFALSGTAALIYEVVWTRKLQAIFGSTIYAASSLLSSFLLGFAFGAYAFRNVKNVRKKIVIAEILIAIYAIALLSIFPLLYKLAGIKFKLFFAFLLLLPPSFLMGSLWPMFARKEDEERASVLYSANSLGASLGPLLAGFFLVPKFGLGKTSLFACLLNIIAALMVWRWVSE